MERGKKYELQVKKYLCKNFNNHFVYLWEETPYKYIYKCDFNVYLTSNQQENSFRDIGCDIMMINKENEEDITIVQCKNYEDKNLCVKDLSGFSFLFLITKIKIKGMIVSNTSYSSMISKLIQNNENINYVKLSYEKISNKEVYEELIPREYQIEACKKFTGKGILQLPCGMGKTLIACMISKKYDNIIIISPLRNYAEQLLNKFKLYFKEEYKYFLVSMDGDREIKNINDKNIISSTFCSANLIPYNLKNSLLIIDEFHNLSLNQITNKENNVYKLLKSYGNTLFLSATPKIYEKINEENVKVHDILNFTSIFGDIFYSYSFRDAIKNNYINDFRVIIPNIKEDHDEMEYFYKNMLYFGYNKCIVYGKTLKQINELNEKVKKINQNKYNIKLVTNIITYNTSLKKRKKIINEFSKDAKLNILFSVHTLDECIDIPECDSVFITYKVINPINIIQRICRCLRINKNKQKSGIFLWCNKYTEIKFICKLLKDFDINSKINKDNLIINNYLNKKIFMEDEINKTIKSIISNNNDVNAKKENILVTNAKKIDFLKKNSNVPEEFINLFINFNKNDISLDEVAVWVGQKKGNIKRTLIKNFTKNIDYTLEKVVERGGKPKEIILLKSSTFKKLCMILNNKKAKEVREYFIKVEETLNKYKDYIIESLKTQMKKMDSSLKTRKKPSKGVIYGFEITDDNRKFIKIGKSKDFLQRMKQHNSSHANKIDVEFLFETDYFDEVESCIKGIMKKYQYRKGKEVYEIEMDKLKELTSGCDKLTKKFHKKMSDENNVLIVIEKK